MIHCLNNIIISLWCIYIYTKIKLCIIKCSSFRFDKRTKNTNRINMHVVIYNVPRRGRVELGGKHFLFHGNQGYTSQTYDVLLVLFLSLIPPIGILVNSEIIMALISSVFRTSYKYCCLLNYKGLIASIDFQLPLSLLKLCFLD